MGMCEKCQDRGFVEFEHGLIMAFCDCEKGKELKAEIVGEIPAEVTNHYAPDGLRQALEVERYARSRLQDINDNSSGIGQPIGKVVEVQEGKDRLDVVVDLYAEGMKKLEDIGIMAKDEKNDSSSGTGQPDNITRGTDTSKPKQPRKQKKGKGTTKRTR